MLKNSSLKSSNKNIITKLNDNKSLNSDNEKNLNRIKSLEKSKENENNYLNLKYSVKSEYILKKIFSFLEKHKELLVINYNKIIQNQLNDNIDDYKKTSHIYREIEKNGMGKEFLTKDNVLIFEGQYENWKRNGEGKEYYKNGNLKFVGEYINGKRIYGREYNNKGNLILIIDKNGKGK